MACIAEASNPTPELCCLLGYAPQHPQLSFAEERKGRSFVLERASLRSRRVFSEFMVCMGMLKVWQKCLAKVTLASIIGD